jgi:hypothetical protein
MSTTELIKEIELDIGDLEAAITTQRAKIARDREEGNEVCLSLVHFAEEAIVALEGRLVELTTELERRKTELNTPKSQGKAVVLTLSVKSIAKIAEVARLNRCSESEALNLILETMD